MTWSGQEWSGVLCSSFRKARRTTKSWACFRLRWVKVCEKLFRSSDRRSLCFFKSRCQNHPAEDGARVKVGKTSLFQWPVLISFSCFEFCCQALSLGHRFKFLLLRFNTWKSLLSCRSSISCFNPASTSIFLKSLVRRPFSHLSTWCSGKCSPLEFQSRRKAVL